MNAAEQQTLLEELLKHMTAERSARMDEVLSNRTRHVCMVLEDIYQTHNASAVLRSCDAFGIQDVHIIENKNVYSRNPDVDMGSEKWLTVRQYFEGENNTAEALSSIKSKGYKLVATTPHEPSILLEDLPVDEPIALMLGTEMRGLTDTAFELADIRVRIPMMGFTESFNLSVCGALMMQTVTRKMKANGIDWKLSEEELIEVKLDWVRKTVKASAEIEARIGGAE